MVYGVQVLYWSTGNCSYILIDPLATVARYVFPCICIQDCMTIPKVAIRLGTVCELNWGTI